MKILNTLLLYTLLGTTAQAATPRPVAAAPTLQDFGWHQDLATAGPEGAYRYVLPASVYAGSRRSDLGDLRVFNSAGELVPHAFLPRPTPLAAPTQYTRLPHFPVRSTTSTDSNMRIDLRADKDGRLSALRVETGTDQGTGTSAIHAWVLDASALKQSIAALRLSWQSGDGMATINVEASDDLQHWHLVRSQAQLMDLRVGEERLLRNRIDIGGLRSKYLRLSSGTASSIEIRSVEAEIIAAPAAVLPLEWETVGAMHVGETPGEYLFYNNGLPVSSLRLTLPQANTVVPLRIYHRDSYKTSWQDAGGITAYRLTHQGQELVAAELVVGQSRDRYWRIVADIRGGGLGPGMPGVALGWTPQEILFIARGTPPFTLAYGNTEIAAAAYAAATLLPGYKEAQLADLPLAQGGVATAQGGVEDAATPSDPVSRNKLVLWSVLLLGMGVLGAMVWRLLRQMNKP